MGWSLGFDTRWNRDIGYGVPAYCDEPGCMEEIDRGLGYVCCGQRPYGGEQGCGRYFCWKHQDADWDDEAGEWFCCHKHEHTSPEHPRWIEHKLTDESWQRWRDESPNEVAKLLDGRRVSISPE